MNKTVTTYQLAYRSDIRVDLCERHAADYRYPLGPVQHGAHTGACDQCIRLSRTSANTSRWSAP